MHTDQVDRSITRLDALEVKAAFTEDLVDQLNEVIVRQQQQIDRLERALLRLGQQLAAQDAGGPAATRGARDELPRHY